MNLLSKNFFYIFFLFLINPTEVLSSCDFKTSKFINELTKPNLINEIRIDTPKSKKYNINFAKILSSKSENIPTNLRKKYKAKIRVDYKFGECIYDANIWQNGDWKKDHLALVDGNPIRSLNVKLENGNILNAVKFKLLIPESRNSLNEVLGSLILRKLGFIAPETFETIVNVNGFNSLMLFQEDSQKELLERNFRKEGPIFEGDETLLWLPKYNNVLELEDISFSRLVNSKWMLNGLNSSFITINAYGKLQNAYLNYSQEFKNTNNTSFISLGPENDYIFQNYYFLMHAMQGNHGLRPHNRKFYFNSLLRLFEPVYYDGNLNLKIPTKSNNELENYKIIAQNGNFQEGYVFPYKSILKEKEFLEVLLDDFKLRTINFNKTHKKFFDRSINSVNKNIDYIQNIIDNSDPKILNKDSNNDNRKIVLEKISNYGLEINIIRSIRITEKGVILTLDNFNTEKVNIDELRRILSRNLYKGKRYTYLPLSKNDFTIINEDKLSIESSEIKGKIHFSKGISFEIDNRMKLITINQASPSNWMNIDNADLTDWTIVFNGIKNDNPDSLTKERINQFGLNGCLNIYNSKFNRTKIKALNGNCEDTVNIVNSKGEISNIEVFNSSQDAVDIDFSSLKISNIFVNKAGNDCLDFSAGSYKLINADLSECIDKGISLGEKSILSIDNALINKSDISISVKDFSRLNLVNATFKNTEKCIEAFQKKQEFGGGLVSVKKINCDSNNFVDAESEIKFY